MERVPRGRVLCLPARENAMGEGNVRFRRVALCVALACAALAAACGSGGGGGTPNIPPFWSPAALIVADFDGDGRIDVAVAAAYVDGPPPHRGYVRTYLPVHHRNLRWPNRLCRRT